jgi:5'-3' exonuclease
VRIIQYLKLLPVKTTILDKVEADDIIAVLAEKLVEKHNSTCFIVSSDKDFLQLVTDKIILYRPMEKEYYTPKVVEEKLGLLPENFILYKTLLGDNSDNIPGIKGLGAKGIFKKFPELKTKSLTLDDIFEISTRKFKDHVVYSRIIQDQARIETSYKVMDLSIPMIDDRGKAHIDELINEDIPELRSDLFIQLYNEDKLGGMIRNLENWIRDIFEQFKGYKD